MNRAEKKRLKKQTKKAARFDGGNIPVPELMQLVQQGIQKYQAGHLAEAEAICHQVLETDPGHADANHLLGLVARQSATSKPPFN